MIHLSTNDIDQLKTIVKDAAKAIMKIYNEEDFDVEFKDDNSPLTRADKASHEVLAAGLEEHFSEIAVLSEEGTQHQYETRKNRNTLWSVDPLDGTKEFIKRNGEFAICLGLVHQGKAVFGMIAIPAQDTLYRGGEQYGSRKQISEESAEQLCMRGNYEGGLRLLGSRSHGGEQDAAFRTHLESEGYETTIVAAGSALKFCKLAEGSADCYPRFKPTMEWDTAAGDALIQGVGMHVVDINTGNEMVYNRKNLVNNGFVAIQRNHDDLLQL